MVLVYITITMEIYIKAHGIMINLMVIYLFYSSGFGIYRFNNGTIFKGRFINGQLHG